MHPAVPCARTASADVLVALLATGTGCQPSAVRALDELDAFERLGICRDSVLLAAEITREGRRKTTFASMLSEAARLRRAGTLSAIEDESLRLLLCRLAAAVVTADGKIEPAERQFYEHLLDTWNLRQADVSAAIRADPAH